MTQNNVLSFHNPNPSTTLDEALKRQHRKATAIIADALPELVSGAITVLKADLESNLIDHRRKTAAMILTKIYPQFATINE